MKRRDQISQANQLALVDLQKEIRSLEQKLQAAYVSVRFGKLKQVHTIAQLRKQIARYLTIAHTRLAQEQKVTGSN